MLLSRPHPGPQVCEGWGLRSAGVEPGAGRGGERGVRGVRLRFLTMGLETVVPKWTT